MKRASTVLRHYSEPDAAMRQRIRTMFEHYSANQTAFLAFNPEFDTAFGTEWLAALDTADTTPNGAVRVGELKEDTAAVTDTMTQAQGAVQSLFYFVGRAFPHNAGRLDTYGRRSYVAARDNHDKMRTLLQTAFTSATRDQAELAAKGYGPTQLATLEALVTQLTDTNTTQEVTKGTNTEGTDHYLTVQNLAYGFGQETSAAAKVLFVDDAATMDLFRLGAGAASPLEHHELTVPAQGTGTITFTTPLLDATRLHLRLAVPKAGQLVVVGREALASQKLDDFVTLSTEISELDVLAPALGPVGQVVLVQNESDQPARVEIGVLQ